MLLQLRVRDSPVSGVNPEIGYLGKLFEFPRSGTRMRAVLGVEARERLQFQARLKPVRHLQSPHNRSLSTKHLAKPLN
jgi:hypothetical protein